MKTLRFALALLAALSIVPLAPTAAFACSCALATTQQYVADADVVVTGRFVERQEPPRFMSSADPVTYTVQVDQVHKGTAPTELAVRTAMSGASCGLEGIELDRPYLVFASSGEPTGGRTGSGHELWASLCGGTTRADAGTLREVEEVTGPARPAADAETVTGRGEGHAGPALVSTGSEEQPAWLWLVGGGLFLGGAAVGPLLWRLGG
jgi:hypothetical protein